GRASHCGEWSMCGVDRWVSWGSWVSTTPSPAFDAFTQHRAAPELTRTRPVIAGSKPHESHEPHTPEPCARFGCLRATFDDVSERTIAPSHREVNGTFAAHGADEAPVRVTKDRCGVRFEVKAAAIGKCGDASSAEAPGSRSASVSAP